MKEALSHQKLRGGYYTPEAVAKFLANWAIQKKNSTVLEPSCGDGNILEAAAQTLISLCAKKSNITNLLLGVEIVAQETLMAEARLRTLGIPVIDQIIVGNFFDYCIEWLDAGREFDAIIGNPPFIRYQNFPEDMRELAFKVMRRAGLRPSRLTNTWVPFLVASALLLSKKNGRIGMVIPAELLQVSYTGELRQFLADYFNQITLITFKKLIFPGIQQEVILFLGERHNGAKHGIRTIELNSIDDLAAYDHSKILDVELKEMDHSAEKWTQYFLSQNEIDLLRNLRINSKISKAGNVIDVDVGVVTGLNEFFVLNDEQVKKHSLSKVVQPIVTRSGHLQGVIFTKQDFLSNSEKQFPSWLINLPRKNLNELPSPVREYILEGERRGYHTGYKCRIRDFWYVVPSIWRPDAFMLRQIHAFPKIIFNASDATSTDTIHRVRFISDIPGKIITTAFLNSLTFAASEVVGRSYGGGVLELEPSEAELLPLPLENVERLNVEKVNSLMQEGDIEAVLDMNDRILLIQGLGLTMREIAELRCIWYKLRDRRLYRKHKRREDEGSSPEKKVAG